MIASSLCGNLYFIKEVRIDGGKNLYHNIIVALFTDSLNIYRQSFNLVSFLLYIVPEMGGGGWFEVRFNIKAASPVNDN